MDETAVEQVTSLSVEEKLHQARKMIAGLEAKLDEKREAQNCALYAALAKAQGAFEHIPKNRSVRIKTTKGGEYSFRYADLEAILSATRPALSENGLALTQVLDHTSDGIFVVTTLVHANGGRLSVRMLMPSGGYEDPKDFAAALSYMRRYGVSTLLCVAADDDLDENGEERTGENGGGGQQQSSAPPELLAAGQAEAAKGTAAYDKWWGDRSSKERNQMGAEHLKLKRAAQTADGVKQ